MFLDNPGGETRLWR